MGINKIIPQRGASAAIGTLAANENGSKVHVFDRGRPGKSHPVPAPDAAQRFIPSFRLLLQRSLLMPRDDWERACRLIAAGENVTLERYAAAFFHGLEVHGRRSFRFFVPGAQEASPDEMWLAKIIDRIGAGDEGSARYLIASRIEPAGRRRLLFLAAGLARGLVF